MLKDIDFKRVSDTAMAVILENEDGIPTWNAYFINTGSEPLESVLIASKGYGEVDGKDVRTSELRQFVEIVEPGEYLKVEEIREELIPLTNQFWISFSKKGYLFDKKYIFVSETLKKDNFVTVPVIEKPGVLII